MNLSEALRRVQRERQIHDDYEKCHDALNQAWALFNKEMVGFNVQLDVERALLRGFDRYGFPVSARLREIGLRSKSAD